MPDPESVTDVDVRLLDATGDELSSYDVSNRHVPDCSEVGDPPAD